MYKEMLSKLFTSHKSDNEIYHDLMQFRVREILLVATIYDAFILEQEGKLTELLFGEYYQLNLSTAPRVTSVAFGEQALEMLEERSFDLVILTTRIDEMTPFELCRKIKENNPSLPVLLLLSDDKDLELIKNQDDRSIKFDRVFTWNGDAKVLLAMVKYVEDRMNVDNDTRIGLVRVILLVEDSVHYYSRYLPVLSVEIMKQTQRIIADENLDEMNKLLRMRTRPKVLLAEDYEEAVRIFEKYRDYLLCVISDVKFPKASRMEEKAGKELIEYFKSRTDSLPVLLQSSNPDNIRIAQNLGVSFLDKNSDNLSHDLTEFIFNHLGFGDFIFRDRRGNRIAAARSMAEFRNLLHTVPDESLVYHSNQNHFSSWLMARGEIQIAKYMQPIKVSDFDSYENLRLHLIEICDIVHRQKTRGKVIFYDEAIQPREENLLQLSGGSVGGKGRGMVFLNMLLENLDLFSISPQVNILIPRTAIIGTEEYDRFMEENNLRDISSGSADYGLIKKLFLRSSLSGELRSKLRRFLREVKEPLAVRSSSLFEDSKSQPFSGIYETYFLPNNHADIEVRQRQLEEAVKLVYSSVYSDSARSYLEAVNYKVGDEKMAVLIQRVTGNRFNGRFYPHISGLAQSYNYYPVSYLEPEDGIAIMGVGLGKYVVEGEKSWRFCPKYPEMEFISQEDMLKDTQTRFYALNLQAGDFDLAGNSNATLQLLELEEAESDGTVDYSVSVWDNDSGSIRTGIQYRGPRIVNFASILKYNYLPLARTIDAVLGIIKNSMGMPVQIEFALDLNADREGKRNFYILQIKPLLGDLLDHRFKLESIDHEKLMLYSDRAMGNGVIDDIRDIIFIDPELFDRTKTVEMKTELEKINRAAVRSGARYILIGPGRWGSRDRFIGIPVRWSDISNARVIVEVEMEGFHFDASLGSHFFHNVTSNGVGYFAVSARSGASFIDWEWLRKQPVLTRAGYFIHARTEDPLTVKMDGRHSVAVIEK
ncbi:MAG: hypothetical protein JXB45_11500 [Candidatus Krumholzibacteriota bacterium]|nr:hypothetical protein [Candidatus Krumholzibacteriota bacterium]